MNPNGINDYDIEGGLQWVMLYDLATKRVHGRKWTIAMDGNVMSSTCYDRDYGCL